MFAVFVLFALIASASAQAPCQDNHPNCPYWAANGFCTHPLYADIRTTCRRSCGLCSGQPSPSACVDASGANCITWVVNGFCNSQYYTDAQKQSYCAASCGYCTL